MPATSGVLPFQDFAEVSDYAKEAVSALISAGLVNGKGEKIAPKDYTTRAEVAVLIKRILDYKSMIPKTDYGDFSYAVYAGAKTPAEQLEEMTPQWDGYIKKANAK